MHTTIVTTITTRVDVDSFQPSHDVEVAAEDVLPNDVIGAAVVGGCKAVIASLHKQYPRLARLDEDTDTDDQEGTDAET